MVFRQFYLRIIVQVLLILISSVGFGMLLFLTDYILAPIHVFLLLCVQVIVLIRFINKFNFRLKSYLEGIALDDWSGTSVNLNKNEDYRILNEYINKIAENAKQAVLAKNLEENYHKFFLSSISILE